MGGQEAALIAPPVEQARERVTAEIVCVTNASQLPTPPAPD
jgi:hypothetical protein